MQVQENPQHPKAVQEIQTNDLDQNTGNYDIKIKDVDIVNMIRSLRLHNKGKPKKTINSANT